MKGRYCNVRCVVRCGGHKLLFKGLSALPRLYSSDLTPYMANFASRHWRENKMLLCTGNITNQEHTTVHPGIVYDLAHPKCIKLYTGHHEVKLYSGTYSPLIRISWVLFLILYSYQVSAQ